MPNPQEVATLFVGSTRIKFTDWESVWVQHRWAEDAPLFRFTAAERDPVPQQPDLWAKLQFKPGDKCAIYLGRQLAIAGIITTRQVAYDANNHGVMLMGKGLTWLAAKGSVITKTMTFDNKNFVETANEVFAAAKYKAPEIIGSIDPTPFKRLRANIGDSVWGFLEAVARTRGVVLGSDHKGNFLLIGKHDYQASNALIEGSNILKAQIIIDRQHFYSDYIFRNQGPADDQDNMSKQAHQEARVISDVAMDYSPLLQVMEHPVWTVAEVKKRAEYEKQWNEGTEVTANITVQGWYEPTGGVLWREGAKYLVRTPMGLLNQALKAKTVTFTQDRNEGTLTTLELVAPWQLNDTSDFRFSPASKRVIEESESVLMSIPEWSESIPASSAAP